MSDTTQQETTQPDAARRPLRDLWRHRWHGPAVVLAVVAVALALELSRHVQRDPAEEFGRLEAIYQQGNHPRFLRLADDFQQRFADKEPLPQRGPLYFLQGRAAEELYREGQGDPQRYAARAVSYYRKALSHGLPERESQKKAQLFIAGQEKLNGSFTEAAAHYRELADTFPESRIDVLPQLIECLRRQERRADAVAAMDEYLALSNPTPDSDARAAMLRRKARVLREMNRRDEALALYEQLLEHFETFPRRGWVLSDMADAVAGDDAATDALKRAHALYDEATDIEGDHRAYALYRKGLMSDRLAANVEARRGRSAARDLMTRAVEEYAEAFEKHRDSPWAAMAGAKMARLKLMLGQVDAAQATIAELMDSGMLESPDEVTREAGQQARALLKKLIDDHLEHERFESTDKVLAVLKRLASEYDYLRQRAEANLSRVRAIDRELEKRGHLMTDSDRKVRIRQRNRLLAEAANLYGEAADRAVDPERRLQALADAGDLFYEADNWIEARRFYRRYLATSHEPLIRDESLTYTIRYRLGECDYRMKNYLSAIDGLKHNVARKPTHKASYSSHVLIGKCLAALRRYEEAMRVFRDFRMGTRAATEEILDIGIPPRDPDDELPDPKGLEWIEALFGQAESEYRHYHSLEARQKDDPEVGLPILNQARLHLDEAIHREPDDPRTPRFRYYLGTVLQRLARFDAERRDERLAGAIEQYRRVIERGPSPELPERYVKFAGFDLGDAYYEAGRYTDAIEAYRRAHDTYLDDPEAVDSRFKIARCYRKLERPEDARAELEKARWELEQLKKRYESLPEEEQARLQERWRFKKEFRQSMLDWDDEETGAVSP